MAFTSLTSYDAQRYEGFFRLANDNDYADVVFLYRSIQEVLVAECHYIKSVDWSGYVQCIGNGNNCPACQKGIRKNVEMFVPLYVLNSTDSLFSGPEIVFWDRTMTFQQQLQQDVFKNYPDPSKYIFRIIRHGVPRDRNTRYEIKAIQNSPYTYDQILTKANIKLPDHYNSICKEVTSDQLAAMLSDGGGVGPESSGYSQYGASPRGAYNIPEGSEPIINNAEPSFSTPNYSAGPIVAPQAPAQAPIAPPPASQVDNANPLPPQGDSAVPELPEGEVSF